MVADVVGSTTHQTDVEIPHFVILHFIIVEIAKKSESTRRYGTFNLDTGLTCSTPYYLWSQEAGQIEINLINGILEVGCFRYVPSIFTLHHLDLHKAFRQWAVGPDQRHHGLTAID